MRLGQFLLKNGSVLGIPKQVERFSKFSPSPLSMKQFLDFGKRSVGRPSALFSSGHVSFQNSRCSWRRVRNVHLAPDT